MRKTYLAGLVTTIASLLLSACGGGNTADTLGGTAAVGAPIVSGTVNVSCAGGGALSTTTDTGGAWQVTISGQTLPCAVQVTGGTANGSANTTPYHSVALAFGTVNVTPLTDLVIANMTGATPLTWFGGVNAAALQAATEAAVAAALSNVSTSLGMNATLGSVNPMTTAFTATSGNTLDNILEGIAAAISAATSDYASLLSLAATANGSSFTAPAGFNFSTAYQTVLASNGGSGGGSVSCASGETALTYALSLAGPHTDGQQLCFTASTTSLAFSGKNLTNPVQNTVVSLPYSAYEFADGAYTYEVIFNAGSLYEINVNTGSTFFGQFTVLGAL